MDIVDVTIHLGVSIERESRGSCSLESLKIKGLSAHARMGIRYGIIVLHVALRLSTKETSTTSNSQTPKLPRQPSQPLNPPASSRQEKKGEFKHPHTPSKPLPNLFPSSFPTPPTSLLPPLPPSLPLPTYSHAQPNPNTHPMLLKNYK